MSVRPAQLEDIESVESIAREVALTRNENQEGFLISNYSASDYQRFLQASENVTFLVSTDENEEVCAFLIAYDRAHLGAEDQSATDLKLTELFAPETKFYVIKQIATSPLSQKQGHASKLCSEFFQNYADAFVFTTIVRSPLNASSEHFFQKHGFVKLAPTRSKSVDGDDTFDSAIWFSNGIFCYDKVETHQSDVLLSNLQQATTLYAHEDRLNWTKVRFLVTILFALILVSWGLGELPSIPETASAPLYFYIISAGIIITSGFIILIAVALKIRSGLKFMTFHKDRACLLEMQLAARYPGFVTPVVDVPVTADTAKVLKLLPGIAMVAWAAASVLLLLRLAQWL